MEVSLWMSFWTTRRGSLLCIGVLLLISTCTPEPVAQRRKSPAQIRGAADTVPLDSLRFGLVSSRGSFVEEIRAIPGFAGTYFEPPCTRVVLVTDPSPRVVGAARTFYTDRGPNCEGERLEIRKAEYPWTQLEKWYFDSLLLPDTPGVTARGISAVRNRLVVGVADDRAREHVENRLLQLPITRSAVVLAITEPARILPTFEFEIAVLNLDRRPVSGVRVEVYRDGQCVRVGATDTTGIATIDSLYPGQYSVQVISSPGFVPAFVPLHRQGQYPSILLADEFVGDHRLRFVLLPFEDWPAPEPNPLCAQATRRAR